MKKRLVSLIPLIIFLFYFFTKLEQEKKDHKRDLQRQIHLYTKALDKFEQTIQTDSLTCDMLESSLQGKLTDHFPLLYLIDDKVYRKMSELKPDSAEIYNNWGSSLLSFSEYMEEFDIYGEQIVELLTKAESMSDRYGAYNLACYYSITENKEEALKWFECMAKGNYKIGTDINRYIIRDESCFDPIRNEPKFKEILNKYFPAK